MPAVVVTSAPVQSGFPVMCSSSVTSRGPLAPGSRLNSVAELFSWGEGLAQGPKASSLRLTAPTSDRHGRCGHVLLAALFVIAAKPATTPAIHRRSRHYRTGSPQG